MPLPGEHAAIGEQRLTGDVRRCRRGEKYGDRPYVALGVAEPAKPDACGEGRRAVGVGPERALQCPREGERSDGIHPYPVRRPLPRQARDETAAR
jgi:hypothetical protein